MYFGYLRHVEALHGGGVWQSDGSARSVDGVYVNGHKIEPGAKLRRVILVGAKLRGADLSGADLSWGTFNDANLTEANLAGADLTEAHLRRAKLRRANLTGADLTKAWFEKAKLQGANLSGANLYDANFSGANLSGANLSGLTFYGLNLSGTNLAGAYLYGADLKRLKLSIIGKADLRGAKADADTQWPKGFDPFTAGVIIENVAAFAPGGSAPEPLPAESQVSVADELEKLADLRDRGVLSEEEFAKQKMKLLE